MLPESHWNSPYPLIEETRKENQLRNFISLSRLWNAPIEEKSILTGSVGWAELFNHQQRTLLETLSISDSPASQFNQLQSASWQYGKSLAEKEWPQANIDHPHDAFLAISSLKTGNLQHSDPFILERKTANSCSFYWLASPIDHSELCSLYLEVFRGFCYHLSRNLRMEIHATILPGGDDQIRSWKINLLWID